ncbi:MAG: hypothetical protein J6I41_05765 [Bacteroidales bacterium]|jgi:hypothetical protein|nr:hypothetical protein [Bacteroidales bacterium]
MKRTALIIAMLAMVLGAKAQWLDWASNNERVEIGFQLGQSATGTEYAKLGFGGSINLLGVHVDFLVVAPEHKYDRHVTNTLYEDSSSYNINIGYQIPILPWLRVMPVVGYCQTNYGVTDATTVNVETHENSSQIYHDYSVYAGTRRHRFNYGIGLALQPFEWLSLYGVGSRYAIYGGISFNLGALAENK